MAEVKSASRAAGVVPGPQDRDRDPKKIADAARQFEALLIGQLLKASHGPDGAGWMGTGDDQAGSQAVDMAEEQLAQSLAQHGGLGLASLVVTGLRQKAEAAGESAKLSAAPHRSGTRSTPPSSPVPGSKGASSSGVHDAPRAGSAGGRSAEK